MSITPSMPDAGQMTRPSLSSTSNCDPMSIAISPIDVRVTTRAPVNANNAKYTSQLFKRARMIVAAPDRAPANLSGSAIHFAVRVDKPNHQRNEPCLFVGRQRRDGAVVCFPRRALHGGKNA